MKRILPPRVFEKSGTYWHVTASGDKRKWTKLCRVREGLPSMYLALAKVTADRTMDDMMPKLIGTWWEELGSTKGEKTQANDKYMTREIADAFAEFRANQVKTTDIVDFLKQFKAMPRTFNGYRSCIRELMRFAEEKGFREPGTNPTQAIKTMRLQARSRYITDSELRRIKVAAHYGKDGKRTRSAASLCAMVDMAYLTGQGIGDLLTLEWSQLGRDGILFARGKVKKTTGAQVLIEWTPRLQSLIERIKGFKKRNIRFVFTTQEGQPYTYSGASTAWKRAVKRAGVRNVHFHDLRAKALTDVDGVRGIMAAQTMGSHSTQTQTADYVRHKTAKRTGATR